MNRALPFLISCICIVSCSSDSKRTGDQDVIDGEPVRELCEFAATPSFEPAFEFFRWGSTERIYPGQDVLFDHGMTYLFVDTNCHFWAFDSTTHPHGGWAPRVSGVLPDSVRDDLLRTTDWNNWKNGAVFAQIEGFHLVRMKVRSAGKEFTGLCNPCSAPELLPVQNAFEMTQEIAQSGAGEEHDPEAIWYRAEEILEGELTPSEPVHQLPPEMEITPTETNDLATPGRGQGTVVSDQEFVDFLWEIRSDYMNLSEEEWWRRHIVVEDNDGIRYRIWFRGSHPLENTEGILFNEMVASASSEEPSG